MPVNINSVGSSGLGGGNQASGVQEFRSYTDTLSSSIGGINFTELVPDNVGTSTIEMKVRGGDGVQYPATPTQFFDYHNEIYGICESEAYCSKLFKLSLTWGSTGSTGSIKYTQVATVGNGGLSSYSVIGNYVYLIASTSAQDYENKHARLYRFDGTTVTDIFGKDMIYLTDQFGLGASSDYYITSEASIRRYYICPVTHPDDSIVNEIIIIAYYFDATNGANKKCQWWYHISLSGTPKILHIFEATSGLNSPMNSSIFTTTGNMISQITNNSYDQNLAKYTYVINDHTTNGNTTESVTLTRTSTISVGTDAIYLSNLSEPLNNNYLYMAVNSNGSYPAKIYLVNINKNGDIDITQMTTSFIGVKPTSNYSGDWFEDRWSGPYLYVSFKYKDPCILSAYNQHVYHSDYYTICTFIQKIKSKYTVSSNNGEFTISGYFEKNDKVYSDDGIFKYTINNVDTTFDADKFIFIIPESGTYVIHNRCSKNEPLSYPAVTIQSVHGGLHHLSCKRISDNSIQALLTSNLSVNGKAVTTSKLQTYTSDTGNFIISVNK